MTKTIRIVTITDEYSDATLRFQMDRTTNEHIIEALAPLFPDAPAEVVAEYSSLATLICAGDEAALVPIARSLGLRLSFHQHAIKDGEWRP